MFPSILIVDDETSILKTLSGILSDEGFETITASNGYEALKILDSESPDLVLLDIWMPGIDGIDTLKEIKKIQPATPVVMITGHGTIETAVNATKIGAFDFIEKPISIDKVIVAINNALNFRRLEEENLYLRKKNIDRLSFNGNSPAIQELKKQIAIAAPTDAWILIMGEHGVGKELAARMLHQLSARSGHPMIDINCAAVSQDRMEDELLGHEKGALPGAGYRKKGKFELAHGSILFFDEIGEMDLQSQGTVVRILQEKKLQRIGGGRRLSIDIRVIASTSKDLSREIEAGKFREDLFYMLNVIPIQVPALRDRSEDLPDLIRYFLAQLAEKNHTAPKTFTPEAVESLRQYSWPGNVRELKNFLERLDIFFKNQIIGAKDIPSPYNPAISGQTLSEASLFSVDRLDKARELFEHEFIRRKLTENDNHIANTARAIGADKAFVQKIAKKINAA
ncbi:MAG: sigma-54 dependent transcriptional regulator [Desulfobacterales bacterium]|jgi:two-component system nitrogen regulation response regulator NtrX|nr:sigma-54 dependent transcriptional regulator [Desulfobacterales bacterium]